MISQWLPVLFDNTRVFLPREGESLLFTSKCGARELLCKRPFMVDAEVEERW